MNQYFYQSAAQRTAAKAKAKKAQRRQRIKAAAAAAAILVGAAAMLALGSWADEAYQATKPGTAAAVRSGSAN